MKIRHRQSGVELEGNFVRVNGSYFSAPLSIPHGGSCYAASEWEAVPEWVNVSGDVEVSADGEALMGDGRVLSRCPVGYRLRKVLFSTGRPPFPGERWAFFMERKA